MHICPATLTLDFSAAFQRAWLPLAFDLSFLCSAFPRGLHLNLEVTHFFHMLLVHQTLLAGKCKAHSILIAPSGRRIKFSCLENNCAEAEGCLRAFV